MKINLKSKYKYQDLDAGNVLHVIDASNNQDDYLLITLNMTETGKTYTLVDLIFSELYSYKNADSEVKTAQFSTKEDMVAFLKTHFSYVSELTAKIVVDA